MTFADLIAARDAAWKAVVDGSQRTGQPYGGDPALWDAWVAADDDLAYALFRVGKRAVVDGDRVFLYRRDDRLSVVDGVARPEDVVPGGRATQEEGEGGEDDRR